MTNQEFSDEFDILYNNISSNQAPGLDDYERSVFLTTALELIIINLYNGKNTAGDFFEKTEETRRYLSNLIKSVSLNNTNNNVFTLPEDLLFITYESVNISNSNNCLSNKELLVQPIKLDDYYRATLNPFRQSNERKVLRLDRNNNSVEIISKYPVNKYSIKYIAKPSPIILVNLDNGLSIEGQTLQMQCKLHPALHRMILKLAVLLALEVYNNKNK